MLRDNAREQRGQSLVEYTVLLAFATLVVAVLGQYVFRSLNHSWSTARYATSPAATTNASAAASGPSLLADSSNLPNQTTGSRNLDSQQEQNPPIDWKEDAALIGGGAAFVGLAIWILRRTTNV
jgi:Flp pilus assembly pilin Flp